jgi:4-amino-4-deoxy-L-arabinose transferase-like glycosyltransferase
MASVTEYRTATPRKISAVVLAAGLCAAIAIARLLALHANATELFFDESQYWAWSRELAFGYYSKPPLIAWIIAAASPVCGDAEFCVRLPAVLLHAATGFTVYLLAAALYNERTGIWSALAYATLPGVAVSSAIISTDVPLLLCWAVALLAFVQLLKQPAWTSALLLGVSLGLGLNAKYAMAYFALCAGLYLVVSPEDRTVLRRPHVWVALGIAAAMITPNLMWNVAHEFATLAHTADNAKWTQSLIHPGKALEFIAAQFGVMGPVLFGSLGAIAWRSVGASAGRLPRADRLLLAFSVPILALVIVQAFLSRAHANWAVAAYVAGTILVIAHLLQPQNLKWLRASFGINGAVAIAIPLAAAFAGQVTLPGVGDPFARMTGSRIFASRVKETLTAARNAGEPFAAVLSDERELTASLIYYGRADPAPVLAWQEGARPRDHFELTRNYAATQPQPVLLVTRQSDPKRVTAAFDRVEALASSEALRVGKSGAGRGGQRPVYFFKLWNFRGTP